MIRVLMVVTSTERLGESETPTGAWLEELAAPFNTFQDAGFEISLASPEGGPAPIDPLSLEQPWLTANGSRFMANREAQDAVAATLRLDQIEATGFDGVFLVGGAGTAWDYPDCDHLARITSALYHAGRPVAAVCHGVLGLSGTVNAEGRHAIYGRQITGVSNSEERVTGFDKVVPVLPEDRLEALGGQYSSADDFQPHVVEDENILTGQNPASAEPLAQRMVDQLTN